MAAQCQLVWREVVVYFIRVGYKSYNDAEVDTEYLDWRHVNATRCEVRPGALAASQSSMRSFSGGAPDRYCAFERAGGPFAAGGSKGARSGEPKHLPKQLEANRRGTPQLSR